MTNCASATLCLFGLATCIEFSMSVATNANASISSLFISQALPQLKSWECHGKCCLGFFTWNVISLKLCMGKTGSHYYFPSLHNLHTILYRTVTGCVPGSRGGKRPRGTGMKSSGWGAVMRLMPGRLTCVLGLGCGSTGIRNGMDVSPSASSHESRPIPMSGRRKYQ